MNYQASDDAGTAYAFILPSPNQPPIALAGAYREVVEGEQVELDGSESSDPDGEQLTFTWEQTDGPKVDLAAYDTAAATFVAPPVEDGCTVLTFQLTVEDAGKLTSTDKVVITVTPNNKIYGMQGKNERHWLSWHKYTFNGSAEERIIIKLEADPDGWHRGNKATLILKDKIGGVWFREEDRGDLPKTITAALSADGEYAVYMMRQPWFCRGKSFSGDYILTVEGTCGKLMRGSRYNEKQI